MRRRRLHRRERKHRNKMIIISLVGLVFLLSCGYAAFQTNISLNAKGTIKTEYIEKNGVTIPIAYSSDGLYQDEYEDGKYIYKGSSPDNYIIFNDEVYRIISFETDGTIKIIKNTAVTDDVNYDIYKNNDRYDENGYCTDSKGCNWWSNNSNTYDNSGSLVTSVTVDGTDYNLPDKDATANQYLNSTGIYENDGYYYNLSSVSKNQIEAHYFNIAPVSLSTLDVVIEEEKTYKWFGNIGLANASDYLNSKLNDNSYMHGIYTWFWFINPLTNYRQQQTSQHYYKFIDGTVYWGVGSSVGIVPVLYLNKDIILMGDGTSSNPYEIS